MSASETLSERMALVSCCTEAGICLLPSSGRDPMAPASLGVFRDASGFYRLPPASYVAIVGEDPGIERGCGTEDKESLHLLLGRY